MFTKAERKRKSPALIMTVGALAAVGVVSIVKSGKKFVKGAADKMRSLVRGADGE